MRSTPWLLLLGMAAAPGCGDAGNDPGQATRPALRESVAVASGPAELIASIVVGPDLVERVGGAAEGPRHGHAESWSPTDTELQALVTARRVVLMGLEFEPWSQRAGLPPSRTITLAQLIPENRVIAAGTVEHTHGDGPAHSHGGTVPTVWTDPDLLESLVHGAAELLAGALPETAGAGQQAIERRAAFQAELDRYSAALAGVKDALGGRTLLATDHGLEYIASHLEIELVVTLLETATGQANDVGLRELAELGAGSGHAPCLVWVGPIDQELAARIESQLGFASVSFDVGAQSTRDRTTLDALLASAEALRSALR